MIRSTAFFSVLALFLAPSVLAYPVDPDVLSTRSFDAEDVAELITRADINDIVELLAARDLDFDELYARGAAGSKAAGQYQANHITNGGTLGKGGKGQGPGPSTKGQARQQTDGGQLGRGNKKRDVEEIVELLMARDFDLEEFYARGPSGSKSAAQYQAKHQTNGGTLGKGGKGEGPGPSTKGQARQQTNGGTLGKGGKGEGPGPSTKGQARQQTDGGQLGKGNKKRDFEDIVEWLAARDFDLDELYARGPSGSKSAAQYQAKHQTNGGTLGKGGKGEGPGPSTKGQARQQTNGGTLGKGGKGEGPGPSTKGQARQQTDGGQLGKGTKKRDLLSLEELD